MTESNEFHLRRVERWNNPKKFPTFQVNYNEFAENLPPLGFNPKFKGDLQAKADQRLLDRRRAFIKRDKAAAKKKQKQEEEAMRKSAEKSNESIPSLNNHSSRRSSSRIAKQKRIARLK